MKLTTRGRYAVTAMLDLALHYRDEPIVLADIGRRQDLSIPYLEQLFAMLRKSGLVSSLRGPGGGYAPNRLLSDISVIDVINAVNEPIDATRCGGASDCHASQRCITHDLWDDLNAHINAFLKNTSFAELVERRRLQLAGEQQESGVIQFTALKKKNYSHGR